MKYKIVEYANGSVDVMLSFDGITWDFQATYDGRYAWEEACQHVRDNVPSLTVMREEIIDV